MRQVRRSLALAAILFLSVGAAPAERTPAVTAKVESSRDGAHDFDWEFGTWSTHVRVLLNPLSGKPPDWAEYEGTSVVRPVSGSRFNLVDLSVEGQRGRIEGASLRLYEPQSRRWSLNFASVRDGLLTAPVYGTFDGHGQGTFFAKDMLGPRPILVRFVINVVSENEARFEQAYSADRGKTWEVNWVAVDRKVEPSR